MSGAQVREEVARLLAEAESAVRAIPPLRSTWPELDTADAYEIQLLNVNRRLAAGGVVVGHKVGLTSLAMQQMLGVDSPDYGHLFADMAVANGDSIPAGRFVAPRAEPEVAFVLKRPLSGPGLSVDDVLAATDYVVPALELIDSRIESWQIGLVDTIADNASSAGFVLGEPRTPADAHGLADVLGDAAVALVVDGESVEKGSTQAVLGHPALAVAWLAETLSSHGVSLEPGHVVLPGSCTRALDVRAGSVVRAEFVGLGEVEVSFT